MRTWPVLGITRAFVPGFARGPRREFCDALVYMQGNFPRGVGQDVEMLIDAAPPAGHVWSSFGGRRHAIRLGELPPGRPFDSTLQVLVVMLTLTTFGSYVAVCMAFVFLGFSPGPVQTVLILAAADAAVVACFWLPAYMRQMALPSRVAFTGEVVKLLRWDGGDASDRFYAWIDDGSPVSWQFDVSAAVYRRLRVGDLVKVSWSPRLARLRSIRPVQTS